MGKMREAARAAALEEAAAAAGLAHEKGYRRLYAWRPGTVSWIYYHDANSNTIDRAAKEFQPVPTLAKVGTGSCRCNCDECMDGGSPGLSDEAAQEMGWVIEESFGKIPYGYFDDEAAIAAAAQEIAGLWLAADGGGQERKREAIVEILDKHLGGRE